MTVSLVLLRHAKSSWDDPALADHDRPLAARGVRDARRMADVIAEHGLSFDEVLCSSALRTRETWARMRKRLSGAPEARTLPALYLPNLADFRAALATARDDTRTLLVVCHSPVIDAFVLSHGTQLEKHGRLLDGIPTGSLIVMRLPIARFSQLAEGSVHGVVSAFITPRSLSAQRTEALAPPSKGERVVIDRHTSVRELACLAFESAVTQLRANAAGAREAVDPAFGHHQRVATRKLRLYVKLFRKQLGHARARQLGQELRWLFERLGALRDHDVFAASPAGKRVFSGDSAALRALAAALLEARTQKHAALVEALESPRYLHLLRDLVSLTAELDQKGKGAKKSARALVAHEVERRLLRVRKRAHALSPDDVAGRHELRKSLKKLRYTADLGRGAFHDKRSKAFLARLNVLQDELGAQNDARVAQALVASASASLSPQLRAQLRAEMPFNAPTLDPLPKLALKRLS